MRKKKVWRYYCDYCKKSGGSAGAMSIHEKHCTMNPNRECRMCKRLEETQQPMKKLLALLPDIKDYEKIEEQFGFTTRIYTGFGEVMAKGLIELSDAVNGCPMCTLAAIRQKGIPMELSGFDYKEELNKCWSEINEQELKADEWATYYS